MIKGTTTIEIKNVHNDETTVIKKNNLVTGAAEKIVGSNPFGIRTNIGTVGDNFSGFDTIGVYNTQFEAEEDNIKIHDRPIAIAATAQIDSSTLYDDKGGTLEEQTFDNNTWTRKWKWGKKYGNGIVSSVCLSEGIPHHITSSDNTVPFLRPISNVEVMFINSYVQQGAIYYYDVNNGIYYTVNIQAYTGTDSLADLNMITFGKYKKEVYKHPIWQKNGASQENTSLDTSRKTIATRSITLTDLGIPNIRHGVEDIAESVKGQYAGKFCITSASYVKDTHKLYVFSLVDAYAEGVYENCASGANSHLYVLECDMTEFEANNTSPTIVFKDLDLSGILTEDTGVYLVAKRASTYPQYDTLSNNTLLFDGTYLYLKCTNTKSNSISDYCKSILKVNIDDITDNEKFWDDTDEELTVVSSGYGHAILSNGFFVENYYGCMAMKDGTGYSGYLGIFVESGDIYPIKTISTDSNFVSAFKDFVTIDDVFVASYSGNGSMDKDCYMEIMVNPMCMSTINNLTDPVIKTPASVMTITYELKEV